jgi:hypothetical protein
MGSVALWRFSLVSGARVGWYGASAAGEETAQIHAVDPTDMRPEPKRRYTEEPTP